MLSFIFTQSSASHPAFNVEQPLGDGGFFVALDNGRRSSRAVLLRAVTTMVLENKGTAFILFER